MTAPRKAAALAEIIRLIPLLFHRLRAIGDALHEKHGITTSMRGVMQSLFDGEALTVPQMAAARPVSRQHIQTIVDDLTTRGLVQATSNPAHKRSSLIVLTNAGRDLFGEMRAEEMRALGGLSDEMDDVALNVTERSLEEMAAHLQSLIGDMKEIDNVT